MSNIPFRSFAAPATAVDGSTVDGVPGRAMMSMAEIRRSAAEIAGDLARSWPTRVFRLVVEIDGVPSEREAVSGALIDGFSGISDPDAVPDRVTAARALNRRMLAVRLAGATMAAFDPARDLKIAPAAQGRLVVRAFAAGLPPIERAITFGDGLPALQACA
ncbi:hypothetical protein [Methyloraptor flagellatus]|uniref:Uncharacterized protein n=1 Tax=Methyloraptor flagellatus TaxID=3162530 RepID=A0AAU7X6R9_9HYPH